jgi:hypothetical protein
MQKIEQNVGHLVAADTKGTISALDNAILSELKLCTTVMEAIQTTSLPIMSSQKLIHSMASGLSHIVAGRGEMAATVRHLTSIQRASNLAPHSFGCPNGSADAMVTDTPMREEPRLERV